MKLANGQLPCRYSNVHKSRLTAAFMCTAFRWPLVLACVVATAGCSTLKDSPTGQALSALIPGQGEATAAQAEAVSFASLALDTSSVRGLAVLGAHTGAQTHWPLAAGNFFTLYHGSLYAMSSPEGDLLATRYAAPSLNAAEGTAMPWQQPSPATFTVERHWVTPEGIAMADYADATMQCSAPALQALVLAELPLEQCEVRYQWQSGATTQGQWWRSPSSFRLWQASEQAWPGGPEVAWQVARPWWNE